MKTILNTIYITNPNRYLSLDGENVVILEGNEEIGRTALHRISGIITFGYAGVSPALMKKCTSYGIAISFMSRNGRFLGRVVGEQNGNVLLRKEQYRISDDETRSLDIAKSFIIGKLYNSRWVIERVTRDHSLSADVDKLKHASSQLFNLTKSILNCESLNSLRGLEGDGASIYFGAFDEMILQQKDEFQFNGRNKRPPLDPVNSMLSYVYTLLAHETTAAAEAAGLDAYVGFLHRDRPGRLSLGLDLMEEFRSVLADRFVLSLINRREVTIDSFSQKESGAVIICDEARKTILSQWQNKKQETITHPFTKEKMQWGTAILVQAQLLARYIRGDMDAYPPLLWK